MGGLPGLRRPMQPVVAYQFLPARKPAVVRRLLAQLPAEHVVAILDLEDSAADIIDVGRTAELKAAARANLVAALPLGPDGNLPPLGVRVNRSSTPYHDADLEGVAELRRRGHDVAVMLPKVESAAEVMAAADFFACRGLAPPRFAILAETGAGVAGLSSILGQAGTLIDAVVLGMIDYAYDQNLWPFPGPFDEELWGVARRVADAAAEHGIRYVHTPCLQLRDAPVIRGIRRRVAETCRGPAAMISLSLAQTRTIIMPGGEEAPDGWEQRPVDPADEARGVVRRFRDNQHAKRSFSVDAAGDRYISPHEYLAAVRFLERQGLAP